MGSQCSTSDFHVHRKHSYDKSVLDREMCICIYFQILIRFFLLSSATLKDQQWGVVTEYSLCSPGKSIIKSEEHNKNIAGFASYSITVNTTGTFSGIGLENRYNSTSGLCEYETLKQNFAIYMIIHPGHDFTSTGTFPWTGSQKTEKAQSGRLCVCGREHEGETVITNSLPSSPRSVD